MNYPAPENNYLFEHVTLLLNSYFIQLGKYLIEPHDCNEALARNIFDAPFVIISHNTEADPVFNYGNLTALRLFEFTWNEFIHLPSQFSAEPVHQTERDRLLAEVNRKGYIENYQGVRITKSGRRFLIKQATVWNLINQHNQFSGQAAYFANWQFI